MKTSLLWKRFLIGCLLLALLTGCATAAPETPTPEPTATLVPATSTPIPPTATPLPPTDTSEPTSCEEVEGICLWLSFDGESCTYEGPTEFKKGWVTLLFINESDGSAAVNLARHTGDETIQDAIDDIGEEPSTGHHPSWMVELGTWKRIAPGESYTWKAVLEPGIHTMVCARLSPLGVWHGTGLTVED